MRKMKIAIKKKFSFMLAMVLMIAISIPALALPEAIDVVKQELGMDDTILFEATNPELNMDDITQAETTEQSEPLSQRGTVTIVYNGNGHTSGTVPSSHTVTTPGYISLQPQGNLARAGLIFVGWQTAPNGGMLYQAGAESYWSDSTSGTITLYAHWGMFALNEVWIVYNGNGHTSGTVPFAQSLATPGYVTLRPQGNLARTGYTFGGWQTAANGGTVFQAESTVGWQTMVSGVFFLYARWVPASPPVWSLNRSSYTFPAATAGYGAQTAVATTISNTGTVALTSVSAKITVGSLYFDITSSPSSSVAEKGSSSVAIGIYAAVLHALNRMDKDLLLIAKDDELGRKLQDLNLLTGKRAPKRRGVTNVNR